MRPTLSEPQGEHEKFLYTVSHDLQEPLRMVTSFLQLLDKKAGDQLNEEARNYLKMSVDNAERMKRMIHALVELSRVNRETEEPSAVDLSEILKELVEMYVNTRNQEVELTCEGDALAMIPLGQAVQLLRILFENAVDNKAHDRSLMLNLYCLPAGCDRVSFKLEDNGIGMKEAFVPHVFDVFRQVKKNPERVGVGLTIARAIVERYGGHIVIESTEDQGTVVTFDLPAVAL